MIATLPRVIRSLRPDLLFCAGNSYAVVAVAMKLLEQRDQRNASSHLKVVGT